MICQQHGILNLWSATEMDCETKLKHNFCKFLLIIVELGEAPCNIFVLYHHRQPLQGNNKRYQYIITWMPCKTSEKRMMMGSSKGVWVVHVLSCPLLNHSLPLATCHQTFQKWVWNLYRIPLSTLCCIKSRHPNPSKRTWNAKVLAIQLTWFVLPRKQCILCTCK